MTVTAETLSCQQPQGLFQQAVERMSFKQQEAYQPTDWIPGIIHSHVMVAGSRSELTTIGYTPSEARRMRLQPEPHQPWTNRITMLRKWYGNLFGNHRIIVNDTPHAAHDVIERVYDRSDDEQRLQRQAFRGINCFKTIARLSEKAITNAKLSRAIGRKPENADMQIITGTEMDLLDPGVRLNGKKRVRNQIIPGLGDITPEAAAQLDWVQMSYHPDEVAARSGITKDEMTYDVYLNMMTAAIKQNPTVDSISHPLRELNTTAVNQFNDTLDIVLANDFSEDTVEETKQANVKQLLTFFDTVKQAEITLELNLSDARAIDKDSRQREIFVTKKLLAAAKKFGCQYFSMGSDLHDLNKWKLLAGSLKARESALYESTAIPDQNLPPGDHFTSLTGDQPGSAAKYDKDYAAIEAEAFQDPATVDKILSPYAYHIRTLQRRYGFTPDDFVNTAASIRSGRFDAFLARRRKIKNEYLAQHAPHLLNQEWMVN